MAFQKKLGDNPAYLNPINPSQQAINP